MNSAIIIPARLASTRLPRKLLLKETGKSILQHTYEAASLSQKAKQVIVAADDAELVSEVESFGGKVVLTDPNHACGTDRIAEVAQQLGQYDLIINVQGDEPEISSDAIDLAISLLEKNPDAPMSTLATPIRNRSQLEDPNCVKVVVNRESQAIYFSRSVIPHPRNWDDSLLNDQSSVAANKIPNFLQHVGLYGYRRDYLLTIPQLPPAPMEKIESLEQLRILFNGDKILVGMIDHPITGIDTAEDYSAFVRRHSN